MEKIMSMDGVVSDGFEGPIAVKVWSIFARFEWFVGEIYVYIYMYICYIYERLEHAYPADSLQRAVLCSLG